MIRRLVPKDVRPYYPSVLDIETDPQGTVIGLGFAWSESGQRCYLAFDDFDGWWEWYEPYVKTTTKENRSRLLRIYAHNGAGFDWLALVNWARRRQRILACKYVINDGFGIGATIRLSTRFGSLRLRDSMRLMPGSLKAITSAFAVEHQKIDTDTWFANNAPDVPESDRLPHTLKRLDSDTYWAYLRNDVLGLQEAIFAFWSLIYDRSGSVGELPMTLPALAMTMFRKTLTDPILTPREKCLKELERRAYRGGRTECRSVGIADTCVFDINSQYPSVMLNGAFPVSYLGRWVSEYRGNHGVYEIEFEQTATDRLPVLYDPSQAGYVYRGTGCYYQPEIELLLSIGGRVIRTIQAYEYVRMGNPFVAFIRFWWGIRLRAQEAGNEGLRYVAKILMNSLYGKFGQRETGWSMQVLTPDKMRELLRTGVEFYDYGDFSMVSEKIKCEYVFVGIAGYVTSQARCLLYRYANLVPKANVVYMDTDSIHVTANVADAYVSTTELGGLKLEKRDETAYAGKKLYFPRHGSLIAKGIGRTAREGIDYETFAAMVSGSVPFIATEFPVFPSPKEVLTGKRHEAVVFMRERRIKVTAQSP